MAYIFLNDAADEPFRLDLSQPAFIGRIGTTTTPIVKAIVFTFILIVLIAFVVKVARTRSSVHKERPVSMLDDIKERLRRDYPKYFVRKKERE